MKIGNNQLTITTVAIVSVLSTILIMRYISPRNAEVEYVPAEAHQEQRRGSSHSEEDLVRLSENELDEFGIEIEKAGPGRLRMFIRLTGEIAVDPKRLAHMIPRFPGIVKEVHKNIGDNVKKGEVLAIIESNESLAPYEMKSLINGTVIDMHLTQGEMISDATHAFTVADLSYVWANLSVYQKDLQFIELGKTAIISAGPHLPEAKGRISYISPVVDEGTRTATGRAVLPNTDGQWRPGMFISALVEKEDVDVPLIVPKTALQTLEGKTVVFMKTNEGFLPQPVTVGHTNGNAAEILSGLEPGMEYVTKGGFTLKAELQKESFAGDEH